MEIRKVLLDPTQSLGNVTGMGGDVMLSLRGFFPRASAPRNGDPWRRERAARSWLRCRGAAGAGCAECDQQGNTRAFALFSRTLTPPPPATLFTRSCYVK